MTIDEAINHAKEVASELKRKSGLCVQNDNECDKFSSCLNCAKEHEQLAKWLEELKAYREQHQALCDAYSVHTVEDIYDKAVDDFIRTADKQCGYYAGECKNLTRDDLLKIAEDLKNT